MRRKGKLAVYRKKRSFAKTKEPKGKEKKGKGKPIFVIQKHDASRLHYDFRLEVGGVLVSWAVPKGPSTDPREKRLAIHVEDHPVDYADFEGVIPEDEYGGGVVIVWDRGPYRNLMEEKDDEKARKSMKKSVKDGHVEVWLEGEKIRGGYALIRTDRGDREQWLLIKMKDDEADAQRNPTSTELKSVLSGRTIEDFREDQEKNS